MKGKTTIATAFGVAAVIAVASGPMKAHGADTVIPAATAQDAENWQMAAHEAMREGGGGMGRRMMEDEDGDRTMGRGMMEGRSGEGRKMMQGEGGEPKMDRRRRHHGEGRRGHGMGGDRHMMAHHKMMHHMMEQHQKHHGGKKHHRGDGPHAKGGHGGKGKGGVWGHKVKPSMNLSVDDVTAHLEARLKRMGNKRLKLGEVTAGDDAITANIVTVDDSLVRQLKVDPRTGDIEYVN